MSFGFRRQCVVDESLTISSSCNECIEVKPPSGAVDQDRMLLSDIPGSKSRDLRRRRNEQQLI